MNAYPMNGYRSDQSQQQHQSYSYMAGTPSLPTLRYLGQTPMQTRSGKMACAELSPISEGEQWTQVPWILIFSNLFKSHSKMLSRESCVKLKNSSKHR